MNVALRARGILADPPSEWAKIDGTGVDPNAERTPMPGVRSGDGVTSGTGTSDAH